MFVLRVMLLLLKVLKLPYNISIEMNDIRFIKYIWYYARAGTKILLLKWKKEVRYLPVNIDRMTDFVFQILCHCRIIHAVTLKSKQKIIVLLDLLFTRILMNQKFATFLLFHSLFYSLPYSTKYLLNNIFVIINIY